MKRLLIVLVASLVLGLVGGVGSAYAGDLLQPPPAPDTSQTATQSNTGSNSADQSATSAPTVVSGPNVAIANGSSCSPCGGSGTTTQNSGNNVDASASNTATQHNTQSNGADQTQAVTGGSDTRQSADQSNDGSNDASQSATSEPVVVSGPNVAALNSGDVNQNSGNNVDASTSNTAHQSNNQTNGAGQSQTVAGGSCCHSGGDPSQPASQSNEGSNKADQSATSAPVVVSGGNYAILNKGDVNQNSGNNIDASSSNTANQRNTQSNDAGQSQTVAGGGHCSKDSSVSQSADQSNSGSNDASQSATSEPVVVSGPNIAVANGWGDTCSRCGGDSGTVNQNSGNNVWAPASNSAHQTNRQSNALDQSQTVTGGGSGCCSHGDVEQTANQSNSASNDASQDATSEPVVTSGWNGAAFNHGPANQNSGNNVNASTSNTATQGNNQSNSLSQSQTVNRGDGCCEKDCHPSCPPPCKPKCEPKREPQCRPKCEEQCRPKCDNGPVLTRGFTL